MPTVLDGGSEYVSLPAGEQLTVIATLGAGRVSRLASGGFESVAAGGTEVFGPYTDAQSFRLFALDGPLSYSTGKTAFPTLDEARKFGTDLVELYGEGAPDASVQASLSRNPAGDDNGLTFTAVTAGAGGDAISVEYLDPGAISSPLSVSVRYGVISVSLETDENGDIVTTAAEVLAAIEASAEASALVAVEIDATDSGSEDDGSGVVTALARASLANGAGVGAGVAGKGSRYTDIDTPALYLNTGTKAVPVWTALAEVE